MRSLAIVASVIGMLIAGCVALTSVAGAEEEPPPPLAIEELTFLVDTGAVDRFIEFDNTIWTAHLAEQPGFLGKEVWRLDTVASAGKSTVKLIVRWRSRSDWNAVPSDGLEATEKRFAEAMADVGAYELIEVHAYQLARTGSGAATEPVATLEIESVLSDPAWLDRAVEVAIAHTPDFGPNRRYRAIRFADLLQRSFAIESIDPETTVLVLQCEDGYAPTMPLSQALTADGWLALEDLDLPDGEPWTVVQAGGKQVDAAPSYLVWRDAADGKLPWPYALTEIRLLMSDPLDAVASPRDMERHGAGFQAFKQHCAKCHRLYGVGGEMGPELVSPRNVTTYWRPDDLKAFIRNPAAYRRGSPMPPMPHLSRQTVEAIVAYLEALPASP